MKYTLQITVDFDDCSRELVETILEEEPLECILEKYGYSDVEVL